MIGSSLPSEARGQAHEVRVGVYEREYKHSVTEWEEQVLGSQWLLGILGGDWMHVNAGHWGGGGRRWPVSMLGRTGTLAWRTSGTPNSRDLGRGNAD